jgi:flagellar biosynthetic protein FliO
MPTLLATIATQSPNPGGPDMTRYVMVCALLLGLICLAAYLFKRFVATAVRTKAAKRSLQVLDVLPLGGKQRVCVVRCYDRTFALGLGDKEVAMIAELDASIATATAPRSSFAALLKREEAPASGATELTPPKRGLFPIGGLFG